MACELHEELGVAAKPVRREMIIKLHYKGVLTIAA
jgi:hypothetical protein